MAARLVLKREAMSVAEAKFQMTCLIFAYGSEASIAKVGPK